MCARKGARTVLFGGIRLGWGEASRKSRSGGAHSAEVGEVGRLGNRGVRDDASRIPVA